MRSSKVVSITLPPEMAHEAEKLAKRENLTMSELMRAAFRLYRREREWDEANAYGSAKARQSGITEADVLRLIKEYRTEGDIRTKTRPRARKTGSATRRSVI